MERNERCEKRPKKNLDRRKFLALTGALAATAVTPTAGCMGPGDSDGDTPEPTPTATPTQTPTPTPTAAQGQPPGLNSLGGPDDLRTAPTAEAALLPQDEGGGVYVYDPAIIWVEQGATVTWEIKNASHSVTAYHSNTDHPLRIPEDAEPFNSTTITDGETFEHTFETPGVYNYYCIPHEPLGMVGLVIVDSPQGGPGTTEPGSEIGSIPRQKLTTLLQNAEIL